jgi:hypothetical protein
MQTGEGRGKPEGRWLMQCYRMREGGCSFHIDLAWWREWSECSRKKLDTRSKSRKRVFDHHDMLDTWMPGAVVIGLFYTYFTPIQAVIAVEGRLIAITLYTVIDDQILSGQTFSSILHQIEVRLVQINSSLHGSFKFNKFYWRHELASIEINGTHESLAYYRSDQR